jgi:hypothetical protein
LSKLHGASEKAAAKTKRVVAEIVGDGKLDEEARQQDKTSEDEDDQDDTDLSRITNNLT